MLPIKGVKPQKIGNSHYFLIPAQYVNNGAIQPKQVYDLNVAKPKA